MKFLPTEARNVQINWLLGGVFYVITFEVGSGEPSADFDFEIPGLRGGTHRTRFEGMLEGVPKELKARFYSYAKGKGKASEILKNIMMKIKKWIKNQKDHKKGKYEHGNLIQIERNIRYLPIMLRI